MDKSIANDEHEFLLQNDRIGRFRVPASQLPHSDAQQRLSEVVFNGHGIRC